MRCHYCGPDHEAWAFGELIVSFFVALAAALTWLVRHPSAALVLTVVAVAAGMVAGGN